MYFFFCMEEQFKLAYFFLYRLCKVIIKRYKQKKNNNNTWTDKSISFFLKSQINRIYSGTINEHFLMPSLFHVQRSAYFKGVIVNRRIVYLSLVLRPNWHFFLLLCVLVSANLTATEIYQNENQRDDGSNCGTLWHQHPICGGSPRSCQPKCVYCGATLTLPLLTKPEMTKQILKSNNSSLIFNRCKAAKTAFNI